MSLQDDWNAIKDEQKTGECFFDEALADDHRMIIAMAVKANDGDPQFSQEACFAAIGKLVTDSLQAYFESVATDVEFEQEHEMTRGYMENEEYRAGL